MIRDDLLLGDVINIRYHGVFGTRKYKFLVEKVYRFRIGGSIIKEDGRPRHGIWKTLWKGRIEYL